MLNWFVVFLFWCSGLSHDLFWYLYLLWVLFLEKEEDDYDLFKIKCKTKSEEREYQNLYSFSLWTMFPGKGRILNSKCPYQYFVPWQNWWLKYLFFYMVVVYFIFYNTSSIFIFVTAIAPISFLCNGSRKSCCLH